MASGRELTLEQLRKQDRLLQNMEKRLFVRLHLGFWKFNEFPEYSIAHKKDGPYVYADHPQLYRSFEISTSCTIIAHFGI